MDMKKLNIPTLDGPNWGIYVIHLQATLWTLDCYDVVQGEILAQPPNPHTLQQTLQHITP